MPSVTIYHNPRCSKSRQTLQLLEEQGITPTIVEYLKTPPSKKTLADILKKLNLSARDLLRTGEADYKEQGLADKELTDDALLQAMVDYPKLIQRPIVIANQKAAIGRPPESVLEIL